MEQHEAISDSDTRSLIVRKQCELVYGNTFTSQISTVLVGALFAGVIYQWTKQSHVFLWLALLAGTAIGRCLLYRIYGKHAPCDQDYRKWLSSYFIAVLTSGVVWAAGTALFFRQDDPVVCYFIAMVVAGIVSGALPTLAPHFPSFCAFAAPNLVIFALRALLVGKVEFHVLGVLTLLFAAMFFKSAKYFNRMLTGALLLNLENDSLVEHLKQERNIAEAASHAKSMFLANMSHEIRTPMNGIIGMTELCLATEVSSEQQHYLSAVKVSADNLLSIINDILDFSKIEVGKVEIDQVPFLLRTTIGQSLQSIAVRAAAKGMEVLFNPAPDTPDALIGDPGRLRQVLINLVSNAIKFADRGQVQVNVRVVEEDDRSCLLSFGVKDEGIGISPEKLKLIFDPFEQADQSSTKSFGGTGLGLAISRNLVELLGGSIRVESELDKGSLFTFTARFEIQQQPQAVHPILPLKGRNALVVDDIAINRAVLSDFLGKWGVTVTTAENAEEALQLLDQSIRRGTPFDFTLIDVQMPQRDGWQLVEDIRSQPAFDCLYTVLMPSVGMRGDSQQCRDLRVDGYLTKPIIHTELHDLLCLLISSRSPVLQPGKAPVTRYQVPENKQRLSILVAEDVPINQLLIKTILARYGHAVTLVANGEEAVQAWLKDKGTYDLIFMDVQMPVMDGLQATRRIRELETLQGGHVPIVAMTAYALDEDKERCRLSGMDDFISKPFHRNDILASLTRLAGPDAKNQGAFAALDAVSEQIPQADRPLHRKEVFNRFELLKRLGNQEGLIVGFISMFIEAVDRELPALEQAIVAQDLESAVRNAHSLKGVAGNIGADRMYSIVLDIISRAKAGDFGTLRENMVSLRSEYDLFKTEIAPVLREFSSLP